MIAASAYPLMDGRCGEYGGLRSEKVALSENADLHIFQDDSYVWICHTMPAAVSVSWDDLEFVTPVFSDGLNLHASAQLGEWPLNVPDAQPTTSSSDKWWNVEGWWANTPGPNGMVEVNGKNQTKWMNIAAREYQISKDRFGRGVWKIRFNLHTAEADGGLTYPPAGRPAYILEAE
jgi:hypothetical protein